MFALYPCNTTTIQEGQIVEALTKFEINAYTHEQEFEPIVMYFYKRCDNTAPEGDDIILQFGY